MMHIVMANKPYHGQEVVLLQKFANSLVPENPRTASSLILNEVFILGPRVICNRVGP